MVPQIQSKIMKPPQLFIDVVKRAAAAVTAAAIFVGPTGITFAHPPDHERQKSEHAVQRLRHIIVIYQENWSFDSLYGQYPGANGSNTRLGYRRCSAKQQHLEYLRNYRDL